MFFQNKHDFLNKMIKSKGTSFHHSRSRILQSRGQQTIAYGSHPNSHLLLQIKFYQNTALLIHLCSIDGCFCTNMTELSSCNRNCMAHKTQNIYNLTLYREYVPTSDQKKNSPRRFDIAQQLQSHCPPTWRNNTLTFLQKVSVQG